MDRTDPVSMSELTARVLGDLHLPWVDVRKFLTRLGQDYVVIHEQDPERFARRLDKAIHRYPDSRVLTVQVFKEPGWFSDRRHFVAILLLASPDVESDALLIDQGPVREQ